MVFAEYSDFPQKSQLASRLQFGKNSEARIISLAVILSIVLSALEYAYSLNSLPYFELIFTTVDDGTMRCSVRNLLSADKAVVLL